MDRIVNGCQGLQRVILDVNLSSFQIDDFGLGLSVLVSYQSLLLHPLIDLFAV